MNFLINGLERRIGLDLNGDGYVGGEGLLSKLERITRFDFNGDNLIGRPPDVYYNHPLMYGPQYGGYGYGPGFGGYGYRSHPFGYFY